MSARIGKVQIRSACIGANVGRPRAGSALAQPLGHVFSGLSLIVVLNGKSRLWRDFSDNDQYLRAMGEAVMAWRLTGIGATSALVTLLSTREPLAQALESGRFPATGAAVPAFGLETLSANPAAVIAVAALIVVAVAFLIVRRRSGTSRSAVTGRKAARAASGLNDRVTFMAILTRQLSDHERNGQHLALHIIDFDGFGAINRTYGYEAGDALLREAANRLGQMVTGPECLARLGSDEIAVIQPDAGATRAVDEYAERLHEALCRPVTLAGDPISPRVSIGSAVAPQHGADAGSLMKSADLAVTSAKQDGGNRSVHFGPASRIGRAMRSEEETLLRSALSNDWIKAYLQPIFDLRERRLMGFEALARIEHPERGLIVPDAFLPMAEETGLIEPVAAVVHRQAMAAAAAWPDHLDLAINLSPAEFRNTNVTNTIKVALAETGLVAERVMVEVTERLFSGDATAPAEQLQALKAMGVLLALDDFGFGLAALTHLCAHDFDVVKIDRTVVRSLSAERSARLVGVMIEAADKLDIMAIAEGVESAEQVQVLANRGCFHAQGDLFSAPLPMADVAPIIMKDVRNRTNGAAGAAATGGSDGAQEPEDRAGDDMGGGNADAQANMSEDEAVRQA